MNIIILYERLFDTNLINYTNKILQRHKTKFKIIFYLNLPIVVSISIILVGNVKQMMFITISVRFKIIVNILDSINYLFIFRVKFKKQYSDQFIDLV